MVSPPNSKTQMGIQLAQQGRRQDALAYLRQAVQVEPANPEVWLWLAHVSPDINEYRNCIYQALMLDPNHPTALQMQGALNQAVGQQPSYSQPAYPNPNSGYQPNFASVPSPQVYNPPSYGTAPNYGSGASQPLYTDNALLHNLERQRRRGRRLRRWVALFLFFGMLIGCGVGLRFLLVSEMFKDWFYGLEWFNERQTVNFDIDAADNVTQWAVEVSVPETWLLADNRVQTWRDTRDVLKTEFALADGTPSIWEGVEADISEIEVDPTTGIVEPPVTLIETDRDAIQRDGQHIVRLQLMKISPYPTGTQGDGCQRIRALSQVEASTLQPQAGSEVSYKVQTQNDGHCIYVIHYENETGAAELPEHVYVLKVPAGDDSYAEWQLIVLDQSHADYLDDINEVIESLQVTERIIPAATPDATTP
jgi:hypothetical protein